MAAVINLMNRDAGKVGDMPKIMQLANRQARVPIQVCPTPKPTQDMISTFMEFLLDSGRLLKQW